MRLLIVEDDTALRQSLAGSLRGAGFAVDEASTAAEAEYFASEFAVQLAIVDLGLPDRSGVELITRLRATGAEFPILILTAREHWQDKVNGLNAGADDYVVKPFSATELLARVEAVLRRSAARPLDVERVEVAGRMIDFARREVRAAGGGEPRAMSERESDVLRYLARNPGRAVSREELLQNVWGLDPAGVETRTVDMHVARLREKLGDDPVTPSVIATVRGKGYMLAQR